MSGIYVLRCIIKPFRVILLVQQDLCGVNNLATFVLSTHYDIDKHPIPFSGSLLHQRKGKISPTFYSKRLFQGRKPLQKGFRYDDGQL